MGFFSFLFELGKNSKKDKIQADSSDEYCESCGELYEDCECDWQQFSREYISLHPYYSKDENDIDSFDK